MLKAMIFVAMGGALGSVARYLVISAVGRAAGTYFPFGTLTANVVGSFILGVLVECMALRWDVSPEFRAMLVVGVMGGFTTFSSFSLEVVLQIERGQMAAAGVYVVSSVAFSILGLFVGMRLMRMILA